tara:strand:- start:550 stop:1326 length:777 start_codon:yes stop_codon:yes gene_type:complete
LELNFLLSGLPRSGITLLSALLNQNPDVYVTTTSPFVEILWRNYSVWKDDTSTETPNIKAAKNPFLRKLTESYYSELTSKPIIIDKRRSWQSVENIEVYQDVFGKLPKIICPVRSVDEIVASYYRVYKSNGFEFDYEKEILGSKIGTINNTMIVEFEHSHEQLKNSFNSKYRDCFLFVEYEDLVSDTANTLSRIYKFMELPEYGHNLNYVFSSELESDYGVNGLHDIRHTISNSSIDSGEVLTKEQFDNFQQWDFWRQ